MIPGGGENAAAARDGIVRCSDLSVLQAEEALRWCAAAAAALSSSITDLGGLLEFYA